MAPPMPSRPVRPPRRITTSPGAGTFRRTLEAGAAPTTAPKLEEYLKDPLKMYLGDIYTVAVNLAGLPAMTVPCGQDRQGLPVGLQLMGDCFQEKKIIRAAYTFEQTREGR